ncbi:MAG TPA: alpha-galactosidase, partial [Chitinophagaceae bacterium]|nr:alpha-galactosidase [Chitinophagaceae bacterium]
DRFPRGMKWLANKIKDHGFKPGIWISPYVISEPTEVFQKHPDWLLKKADGSLKRIGNWEEGAEPPADEIPKRYGLDITHPEAAKWLHDLIDTVANGWGYDMIKIDFVAWSILAPERYYDPTLSSAQVYRKGLEIIRKAAGDKCHILECGPGATTVGLIDSMRLEADVNYGFSDTAWETYFLHPACSASAAAKRYYFHKRTWINDVDHVCLDLLNNQQSEAAATLIALSGGNMMSGDRLTQFDRDKLDILKKIAPAFGEAATPVDLFDDKMQSVFALKIKKLFAEWTIAAFFNSSLEQIIEKKFSLQRLWLDPRKTYLAFDFWKQQFIGEITGEIKLTIQPGSVVLLTIHEKTGHPQFISTDRHVMQGALEIENTNWNKSTKTISGTSIGPPGTSHNVFVYIPQPHPWTWSGAGLFQDHDSYSLKLVDNNIIRVHVDFQKSDHVKWEIRPDDFLK